MLMRGGWEEAAAHAVLIRRWMAAMHAPDLLYDVVMMQRLLLLLLQKMLLLPPAAATAAAAAAAAVAAAKLVRGRWVT